MQIYGTPIPAQALSLVRYSAIIGYTEWAFFGISHPDNTKFDVRRIWSKSQRDDVVSYIAQAQEMVEGVVGCPMASRWIADERHTYGSADGSYLCDYANVTEVGVELSEEVSSDVPVSYLTDPPTVSVPFTLDIGDEDLSDIHVFYPDTDEEILFSSISIGAGPTLNITIPRARLVSYALLDNPEEGWVWSDDTKFQLTVDVRWIHNDNSTDKGNLVGRPNICTSFSAEVLTPVGQYIRNKSVGVIQVGPARAGCNCGRFEFVSLNYKAGFTSVTRVAEGMLVRLAHSLMPNAPCSFDMVKNLWNRDTNIPKILTRERVECPFGMSDGAWVAWKWANSLAQFRLGIL